MRDADEQQAGERQLRELLERTVPVLPAPADRMRQVHKRVRTRSRRRRALAATVVSAAAVALFHSPLVQPLQSQVAAPPSEHRIALAGGALRLDVPDGWYAREQAGPPDTEGVLVANRPVTATPSCLGTPARDGYPCASLPRLAEGEAVISFSRSEERDRGIVDTDTEVEPSPYPAPGERCRALGGDQEWARPALVSFRPGVGETVFPFSVRVCLNGASATTLTEVREIVIGASYDDAATSAPGSEGGEDGWDRSGYDR
ncbi:hypothetical protein BU52_22895 [Streptomyces toyocaensis]|uniref:Uncharacterized protein n=1 Tax=Streptomyces toyocaensis TaxID=55952 RepID=A0A081XMW8_STRTO|nr:hypothetical protein [Streptomyces toyocaensis]KES04891.1 hypothetical protein BU52_22895 [Streptomyces toyocaensis]